MSFQKAVKTQAKLKIGLSGPSGSGKTYSALLIAQGMGGRIAVIDTENGSASLYADRFDFDTMTLQAPFTTEKYLAAMKLAESYDIVIVDSVTQQWMGDGGLYERKTLKDARGGNSFTNWAVFTPEHNKFLSAIVQYPTHLICTVRSKQDYAVNDKGRPDKLGLAPVQREGFEYELTVMLDIAMNHSAQASKDRTSMFNSIFTISEDTGKVLMGWLATAKPLWKLGESEKEKLHSLMSSFPAGKQSLKYFESINGPAANMREDYYLRLLSYFETCKEKAEAQAEFEKNVAEIPAM